MKNIIHIDATNDCNCNLIANVVDGTNRVVLEITVDISKNAILEINGVNVEITSSIFSYEIDSSLLIGSGNLQFRITDDDHTGEYFSIVKVAKIEGSLFLQQNSNFEYVLIDKGTGTSNDLGLSVVDGKLCVTYIE